MNKIKIMTMKKVQVRRYEFFPRKNYIIEVEIDETKEDNLSIYINHKEYGTKLYFCGLSLKDEVLNNESSIIEFCEELIRNNIRLMVDSYENIIDRMEAV